MPMSRLELAAERLAIALENLEKAADSAGNSRPPRRQTPPGWRPWKRSGNSSWCASLRWRKSWPPFPA